MSQGGCSSRPSSCWPAKGVLGPTSTTAGTSTWSTGWSPPHGPHTDEDYTEPANLERLRDRNVGHKRSLAGRECALGIESLERAVRREPLWRVHEAVFAVLALESEPVDPRL